MEVFHKADMGILEVANMPGDCQSAEKAMFHIFLTRSLLRAASISYIMFN